MALASHFDHSHAPEMRQKIENAGQLERHQLPLRVGRSLLAAGGHKVAESETPAARPVLAPTAWYSVAIALGRERSNVDSALA